MQNMRIGTTPWRERSHPICLIHALHLTYLSLGAKRVPLIPHTPPASASFSHRNSDLNRPITALKRLGVGGGGVLR